ncbi:ThuA domain-containing protein [Coraliomargarita akajimensis]|uniref:Putative glycosyl hydrolase (Putative secreted protein) n=1 Tax=Coraliomargarita akajimensis (strain DSM 45221 / IAM 15411 / JCM 23193 / KCTC 12865 / 04OKA010-24) TaxID=583355 RepID=D5EQZ0_CORAD|nr:ThuA domain-containing protein [Coraliomargarita akajimensis]ADE53983.1 putative glycosyl hydrolase (putative secreted protein) [Coraliomargarita akajimensis DSM 45221]
MKTIFCLFPSLLLTLSLSAANVAPFELNAEWSAKIEGLAPTKAIAEPKEARKVLIFTLMTGFKHWATPHTAEVVRILGEKTGAYEAVISDELSHFEKGVIDQYDAIVLINNCSKRPERHLFLDALGDMEKAVELERNLINFVASGKGVTSIHGAIVIFNNSEEFGELSGGAFAYHPKQTMVTGKVLDHEHPICTAFEGGDLHHKDEPYCFKGAYLDYNFHPLLEMELPEASEADRAKVFTPNGKSVKRYIAWIKPYGDGRFFYCSPSHNAQSFEDPQLLQFVLNGIQYTLGDLECDDTPISE